MAKHAKKRKPQHHNPLNTQNHPRPEASSGSKQKLPINLIGIVSLVLMCAGIIIAAFSYYRSIGCILSIVGATINLIHASIRKNQTIATIVIYVIYVALIFFYWFR